MALQSEVDRMCRCGTSMSGHLFCPGQSSYLLARLFPAQAGMTAAPESCSGEKPGKWSLQRNWPVRFGELLDMIEHPQVNAMDDEIRFNFTMKSATPNMRKGPRSIDPSHRHRSEGCIFIFYSPAGCSQANTPAR